MDRTNVGNNAEDRMKLGGELGLPRQIKEPPQPQNLEAIGQLTKKVSHDFNNLVAAALMHMGAVRQNPRLAKHMAEALKKAESEISEAANLARQFFLNVREQATSAESRDLQTLIDRVYSPKLPKPAEECSPASSNNAPRGGSETILLVEDDLTMGRMMALCLRKLGYAVLEAGDTTQAFKFWEQHGKSIELLITDMVMPETMSGLDLAERFKREQPSLRVIISSGMGPEGADSHPLQRHATFLPKPFLPVTLAKTVRQCLDQR